MHRDDLMTPVERANALAKGESVDRMPISMFYTAPAHSLLGWTRRQELESAQATVDVQKKYYERFGSDSVGVCYGLHGMPIAFGAITTDTEHEPVSIEEHPITDIKNLSLLELDRVTVQTDPTAKRCFEAALILRDELGDEVPCGVGLTGPFTCASGLVGTERLLKALVKNPEQVHQLMNFVTEANIQIAKSFITEGFGFMVSDPVASGTIIQKKWFQEFVHPYAKRFVNECKAKGPVSIGCHICGDTTPILENIADCGFDTISVDNIVDLEVAKGRIGQTTHLLGNVDPVNILHQGTPEQVDESVKSCFRKAWDSPLGFTIGTGCDTPYGTPVENSLAFMAAARKYGKYPVTPDNFQ